MWATPKFGGGEHGGTLVFRTGSEEGSHPPPPPAAERC